MDESQQKAYIVVKLSNAEVYNVPLKYEKRIFHDDLGHPTVEEVYRRGKLVFDIAEQTLYFVWRKGDGTISEKASKAWDEVFLSKYLLCKQMEKEGKSKNFPLEVYVGFSELVKNL